MVQPGDTLFSIAYHFKVSMQLLKSINLHLSKEGTLFEHDIVFVPLKDSALKKVDMEMLPQFCTV